jgi:uncharacterized membrane protein YqjE
MAETALSTLQNRIELFAVEMQEEKAWLISTLIWAAAAMFFCGLAIIFTVGTIVVLVPEEARGWVLAGFALVFILVAVNAVAGFKRVLRSKPPPLAGTLGEIKKDIAWIQSRD